MSSIDSEHDGGVKLPLSRNFVPMTSYGRSDRPEANTKTIPRATTAAQVREEVDDWTYEMLFVGFHFAGFTYGFMARALGLRSDRPEMILTRGLRQSSLRTERRWSDTTNPLRRWRYVELIGDMFAGYFNESSTARLERKRKEVKDHGGYFFEMHDESLIIGHTPACNACGERKFHPAVQKTEERYGRMVDKMDEIFDGLRAPNDRQSFDGEVDDGGSGRSLLPAKSKQAIHAPFDKWPGTDLPPVAASAGRQSRTKTYDDKGRGRMRASGSDRFERDDCRYDSTENLTDYENRMYAEHDWRNEMKARKGRS
ncbi:MAG: hypothetical protein LQ344_007485 [Seirophora lacunosa]|nr:MAG: hypothetical protein LQ344_007485 [Seirophora lacunosa]